jgi:hypothetical protein
VPRLITQTRGLDFGSGFYLVDQICLKTAKAIAMLGFVRAYETKGGI